jgi:hypothetical protein
MSEEILIENYVNKQSKKPMTQLILVFVIVAKCFNSVKASSGYHSVRMRNKDIKWR